MLESTGKVLEGVFAVKKPPFSSSAQILRDLQDAFAKSKTFQPLLQATQDAERRSNYNKSKRRRIDDSNKFKMGHGGTLDPLATGVLIVGIGRGTKSLQDFLYCTKTYETVVLFGKSTDTYDIAGKVVATGKTSNITQEMVVNKLASFRGKIKQVPPIYSALKIDGMKAYDYARSGKPLPRELPARDMEVEECELLEWFESGSHEFRWPATSAEGEEQAIFQKIVHREDTSSSSAAQTVSAKTSNSTETATEPAPIKPTSETSKASEQQDIKETKAKKHTHELTNLCEEPADAPAARIRLTVSSGFYVRSFCHDLGMLCGSYATMAELARTRQAEFTTSDHPAQNLVPAIDYADLHDEDSWAPLITSILEKWLEKHPQPVNAEPSSPTNGPSRGARRGNFNQRGRRHENRIDQRQSNKRRNSSSPEPE